MVQLWNSRKTRLTILYGIWPISGNLFDAESEINSEQLLRINFRLCVILDTFLTDLGKCGEIQMQYPSERACIQSIDFSTIVGHTSIYIVFISWENCAIGPQKKLIIFPLQEMAHIIISVISRAGFAITLQNSFQNLIALQD